MGTRYLNNNHKKELASFLQEAVRIPSFSDEEGSFAVMLVEKMKAIDFDEAYIDSTGNVVGRVGR